MVSGLIAFLAASLQAANPSTGDSLSPGAFPSALPPLYTFDTSTYMEPRRAEATPLPVDTLSPGRMLIREFSPHRIMTLVFKPLDWVLTPTVKTLSYPLKPAIRYADSSGMIDRANTLIHAGDNREKRMLYPVASITGGSDSRAGLRYRDLFSDRFYTDAAIRWEPQQEWGTWLSAQVLRFPAPNTSLLLRYNYYRTPGTPVWIPNRANLRSSASAAGNVSEHRHLIGMEFSLSDDQWSHTLLAQWKDNQDTTPVRLSDSVIPAGSWFGNGNRGTAEETKTYIIGYRADYNSVNHEGIPTHGLKFSASAQQAVTEKNAGMATVTVQGVRYFLLGKERYVYRRGDLDPYLKPDPQFLLDAIDPSTLWQRLTERRIVAFYSTLRQSFDDGSGQVPWFLYPSMNGDITAQAYDQRITGDAVAGAGFEYRWPIWKYIDGTLFAECAHTGPHVWSHDAARLAPGWGFGIRVRNQSSFFFRLQVAIGRQGPRYIITTDPGF